MRPLGAVDLFAEDPDLLPGASQALTGQILCRSAAVDPGLWRPAEESATHFGLLVLDGLMIQRIEVDGARSVDLIGRGDPLSRHRPDGDSYADVSHLAEWRVLQPMRLALLDETALGGMAPQILAELACRFDRRTRAAQVRQAITRKARLDERLYLLLWHLADQWGTVGVGGTVLRLPFSQELLGDLMLANRRAVGPALRQLETSGAVGHRPDGGLVLLGSPPVTQRTNSADPD